LSSLFMSASMSCAKNTCRCTKTC